MRQTNLDGKTLDITQENIKKLKELFPEIITEDQIDFDKLKKLLGDNAKEEKERYNFTWNGKGDSLRLSQTPSLGTLRPCKDESVDWEETQNLYIEGDNLEVLKLLQKSYYGKIKMIYIDPPYNTGKDFVYSDDYEDNLKNYMQITGQADEEGKKVSTNTETSGRYHTNWLNMMYPRLRLARNLLSDDGVIFISIDDNECANLKKICDEIFGEDNFVGDIIWNSTKSVTNTAIISVSHTHNLCYFRSKDYYITNRHKFRLPEEGHGFNNPDNDPRGPWKADPFQVGGWRPNQQYEIVNPNTRQVYRPNPGCSWKNDYTMFQTLLNENRIVFGVNGLSGPQRKRFLHEALERGRVSKTLWTDIDTTSNATDYLKMLFDDIKIFDNPKPCNLIRRFMQLGTSFNTNDIILDFFSGSATTGDAVMQLNAEDGGNRKYIMVQLPEPTEETSEAFRQGHTNISDIGKERLRRAGGKILGDNATLAVGLDIGFKVFKLDTSNIKKWNPSHDNIEGSIMDYVNNFLEGREHLDIVYEIMLKYGLDLTYPVLEYNIEGKKVYSVGEGMLIICLEDEITTELATGILNKVKELSPESTRIVTKDNGFKSDSDKTNVKEILKNGGIEEFITL